MFDKTKMTKVKSERFQKMSKMTVDEYVESYVYDNDENYVVHVGVDDYGQCYFLHYSIKDKDYEIGCGTYNIDYISEIEYVFKHDFKV